MAEVKLEITTDASGAVKGITATSGALDKLGRKTTKLQKFSKELGGSSLKAIGMGAAMGGAAAGVTALGVGLASSVRTAASFETSLVKMETLVGLTTAEVEEMKGALLATSRETGQPLVALADTMFNITSAGLRGKDAIVALEAAAKGAAIGLGDANTVADAATSIVNAYGVENINASKAVDLIVRTIREGKTAPDQLAASLGSIIPISSQMGVSFEEVGAGIAKMTRTGASASEAVTRLNQIMLAFLKPSEKGVKIVDALGTSMAELRTRIREEGLLAVVDDLRSKLDDESFSALMGRADGLKGSLALVGDEMEGTIEILGSMNDALGSTEDGFGRVAETAELKAARVRAVWEGASTLIGGAAIGLADAYIGAAVKVDEVMTGLAERIFLAFAPDDFGELDKHLSGMGLSFEKLTKDLGEYETTTTTTRDAQSSLANSTSSVIDAWVEAAESGREFDEVLAGVPEKTDKLTKAQERAAEKARKAREEYEAFKQSLTSEGEQVQAVAALDKLDSALSEIGETDAPLAASAIARVNEEYRKLIELGVPVEMIPENIRRIGEESEQATKSAIEMAQSFGVVPEPMDEIRRRTVDMTSEIERLGTETDEQPKKAQTWAESSREVSNALSQVRGVMGLLGVESDSTAGRIIDGFSKAWDMFNGIIGTLDSILGLFGNLGSAAGGLGSLFGSIGGGASGGGGGLGGLLGGLGGLIPGGGMLLGLGGALAGGIGALIGGIGGGRDEGTVQEEFQRDLGVSVGEEFAKAVHESGLNPQAFVDELARSGQLSGSKLAEEIGDVFSVLESGGLDKATAEETIAGALPTLIEQLKSGLIDANDEQVQRILGAGDRFGIDVSALAEALAGLDEPAPAAPSGSSSTSSSPSSSGGAGGGAGINLDLNLGGITIEGLFQGNVEEGARIIKEMVARLIKSDPDIRSSLVRLIEQAQPNG